MNKKQINRLKELDLKAESCKPSTTEEINERNELEFLRNKQNIK